MTRSDQKEFVEEMLQNMDKSEKIWHGTPFETFDKNTKYL